MVSISNLGSAVGSLLAGCEFSFNHSSSLTKSAILLLCGLLIQIGIFVGLNFVTQGLEVDHP